MWQSHAKAAEAPASLGEAKDRERAVVSHTPLPSAEHTLFASSQPALAGLTWDFNSQAHTCHPSNTLLMKDIKVRVHCEEIHCDCLVSSDILQLV